MVMVVRVFFVLFHYMNLPFNLPVSAIAIAKLAIVERTATAIAACLHLFMSRGFTPGANSMTLLLE